MTKEKPSEIISLGCGVQSSCLALKYALGEIKPMPLAAIFADTGWENKATYNFLEFLKKELPFPVHVVSKGNLQRDIINAAAPKLKRMASPPFYTESEKGGGILRRQCTIEYKITPIQKKCRELVGLKPRQRAPKGKILVTQAMGISFDEMQRMRESTTPWVVNRYPLVELEMRRHHCLEWMNKNGYPKPPRSACVGCPYHHDILWRDMKLNRPDEWADAVEIDELIRGGISTTKEKLYLHPSLTPLKDVDLRSDIDRGQLTFLDECDGMCGV